MYCAEELLIPDIKTFLEIVMLSRGKVPGAAIALNKESFLLQCKYNIMMI